MCLGAACCCRHGASGKPAEEEVEAEADTEAAAEKGKDDQGKGGESEDEGLREKAFEGMVVAT
jgi:hypothetical protein